MYRYRILDQLPPLPEDLYQHAMAVSKQGIDQTVNTSNKAYTSRTLKKGTEHFPSTYSSRTELGEEFERWIHDNIVSSWTECSVSRTSASLSHCHGPHTDKTRNFLLMYLMESGGDNCRTVWYQEKSQPFYRPGKQWLAVHDFDSLEEKESVCLPVNKWAILNTNYLHGVENIERDRVAVHIGLDDDVEISKKFTDSAVLDK
jgi:hypothetical protein